MSITGETPDLDFWRQLQVMGPTMDHRTSLPEPSDEPDAAPTGEELEYGGPLEAPLDVKVWNREELTRFEVHLLGLKLRSQGPATTAPLLVGAAVVLGGGAIATQDLVAGIVTLAGGVILSFIHRGTPRRRR